MRKLIKPTLVVAVVLVLFLACAWVFFEKQLPPLSRFQSIKPGMSRQEVVNDLGVFYDDYSRGLYPRVDQVIARMDNSDSVVRVAQWHLSFSSHNGWVGWDKDEIVVSTWLEIR